ncbi:hypothetical protein M758_10G083700 [Ceratodon purpureus]|nr:hypothetical protein M758_10G083700 [Ceratodon purpureus]
MSSMLILCNQQNMRSFSLNVGFCVKRRRSECTSVWRLRCLIMTKPVSDWAVAHLLSDSYKNCLDSLRTSLSRRYLLLCIISVYMCAIKVCKRLRKINNLCFLTCCKC